MCESVWVSLHHSQISHRRLNCDPDQDNVSAKRTCTKGQNLSKVQFRLKIRTPVFFNGIVEHSSRPGSSNVLHFRIPGR